MLMKSFMVPFVLLIEVPVNDPLGGFRSQWMESVTFDAFIRKEDAPEVTVAEKSETKERLIIVVPKDTPLKYHSVVRRVSDSETYRVTSTLKDFQTPAMASAQIARADIERWELT